MKATKFFVIALVAATLAACGGKSKTAEAEADSTEVAAVADSMAAAAGITSVDQIQSADQITDSIEAAIETGDQTKAQSLVTILQQKVEQLKAAGDETTLKEYAQKIADLCKDKAEQIKSLGNVGTAISTAATATGVTEAVSALKTLGIDAAATGDAAAQAAVDGAKSAAESAVNDAKSKANDAVNNAKSKADEAVKKAQSKANDAVNNAKSKANEAVSNAAKKALGL